ncbi:MAG: hypothetical protein HQM14_15075 [SAR324 cluster bacterium]|nr:hypothetical protein [SAR324 cluster bacterium]
MQLKSLFSFPMLCPRSDQDLSKSPNEFAERFSLVFDSSRYSTHQNTVVDCVEKFFQVNINRNSVSSLIPTQNFSYCIMCRMMEICFVGLLRLLLTSVQSHHRLLYDVPSTSKDKEESVP